MITIANLKNELTKIPASYKSDAQTLIEAIEANLHKTNKEVKAIVDGFLNTINEVLKPKATTKPKKVTAKPEPKATTTPKTSQRANVFVVDIKTINIDKKRFQNREKLNETVLQNIVDNFDETILDPVMIWIDPKDKKTYLLAGHHRLEASRLIGKKTIQAKYYTGTEAQAINYAKVESNANRSLETPIERAKIYREMLEKGKSKKEVTELAKKIEGNNATFILNLAYLKPGGVTLTTLQQFENTDVQNYGIAKKQADWIGEAMRLYSSKLTYNHEREMFDFLNDANSSKRIKTKGDLLQKITATVGGFDFDSEKPLNLKRFKYQSEGEQLYDEEYNELKNLISTELENKANLKDRISNPKNPNYIDPSSSGYDQVLATLDKLIAQSNDKLKVLQNKITELSRNKKNYINAGSNQAALFGAKNAKKKSEDKPHSKAKNVGLRADANSYQFFKVNGEIGKFLQRVERKPVHSVAITLDGPQGAGKTTTVFNMIDAFAGAGNKSVFFSLEEHPESFLFGDKVDKYLSEAAKRNVDSVGDIDSLQEFYNIVKNYDVVFIDSWQKLIEMVGNINFDQDLRKKFNGKVFVVIFQQTTTGSTRGGAKILFDGDIIIKMFKGESFAENYAYFNKHRYTVTPIENIRLNVATAKTYNPNENIENDIENSDVSPVNSSDSRVNSSDSPVNSSNLLLTEKQVVNDVQLVSNPDNLVLTFKSK